MKQIVYIWVTFGIISLLCIEDAHAYIDPGTVSMLLQAFLAGGVAVIAFWRQIKTYFVPRFGSKDTANEVVPD